MQPNLNAAIARMRRTLVLAGRGLYTTSANPRVGCLLVHQGRVVGEGWHRGDGELHAEAMAIAQAGKLARGATAYTSLEPCCHQGKQPPCTRALIAAGVAKVVVAMHDPNPRVGGSGLAELHASGIEVSSGLLEHEAAGLNPGFIARYTRARPWLVAKLAISLDGRIAASDGSSAYISCQAARHNAMHWRARSQAILTSSTTVLADNPRLNVRGLNKVTQPDVWLVDRRARVGLNASIFAPIAHTSGLGELTGKVRRIYWQRPALSAAELAHLPAHVEIVPTAACPDLSALLHTMAGRGVNEVLTECGGGLVGALLTAGLVDRLLCYLAPSLLGSGLAMANLPVATIAQAYALRQLEARQLGNCWRLMYEPVAVAAPAKATVRINKK